MRHHRTQPTERAHNRDVNPSIVCHPPLLAIQTPRPYGKRRAQKQKLQMSHYDR